MSILNPELVLSWTVLALINGEVATTRERSRWAWMALSVPLGPVATLLLVALPPRGEAPGRTTNRNEG